jgi:acyl carrier protein
MDSLDNIDLVIKLEDAFSVTFTDRETDSMDTWMVKDVYDHVESKL